MRPLCFRRGWQRQRRQPKSHIDLCISTIPYGPLLQTTSTTALTIFRSFLIFARLQLERKLPQPPPADDQPPPTVHTLVVANGQLTSKQSEASPHISNVNLPTDSIAPTVIANKSDLKALPISFLSFRDFFNRNTWRWLLAPGGDALSSPPSDHLPILLTNGFQLIHCPQIEIGFEIYNNQRRYFFSRFQLEHELPSLSLSLSLSSTTSHHLPIMLTGRLHHLHWPSIQLRFEIRDNQRSYFV